MVMDLRKWIQDLSLHSFPCFFPCRHHVLRQSCLQKSFLFESRARLNEFLLSQDVRDLDHSLPVAIYRG